MLSGTPSKVAKFSSCVAQHYNELQSTGLDVRMQSKIFYLRNFNNWIKGTLINNYLDKLGGARNVLDMCCGRGGDLFKWRCAKVQHVICADIAGKSVELCKTKYDVMKSRNPFIFSSEFITADCTRVCLREKFQNPSIEFDLVSCQFSFHYCFESLPQAERMLKNASECLRTGGYFIGTIPDANVIVNRIKKSGSKFLKNKIFSIEMMTEEPYPLFGACYDFHLDSVVDCPEFLVHFPTFVKLAAKYDLALDYRAGFEDFYSENCSDRDVGLLKRMLGLKAYDLHNNSDKQDEEYSHVKKYCGEKNYSGTVGTISKSEWEVISLYQVFAFKKLPGKRDKNETFVV